MNAMSMPMAVMLDESKCFRVSGIRSAEHFFEAVSILLPDATLLLLEGSPGPDVRALLAEAADDAAYAAPIGTRWPQSQRYSVRASSALFVRLAEVASHHAEPEICDHLHLYRGQEALAQWFDAFSGPLLVSRSVSRERVERFASAVGGALSEGTG